MLRKLKARSATARKNLEVLQARLEIATRIATPRAHGLEGGLVVSLASYPARYGTLGLTLKSLLRQTVRADATILWVDKDHQDQLPADVLALRAKGLTIGTGENIRSYNKIIPALRACPGSSIVTADDDVHYPSGWLEQLVTARTNAPATGVFCHRSHRVVLDGNGLPLPYRQWQLAIDGPEQSPLIFPTGVLGVLYGPDALHPDTTRSDLFRELSPTTDDVWLYWMFRMTGNSATRTGSRLKILEWPGSQATSLRRGNVKDGGNDKAIAAMIRRYGFP